MQRFKRWFSGVLLIAVWAVPLSQAQAFDHRYAGFDRLLKHHVSWSQQGGASSVDYAGLAKDSAALDRVLAGFSKVSQSEYAAFERDQKLAFLINAYNGFTLAFILTEYPSIDSIKDLGSFFSSPWKKSFFSLLGENRTLDWIEHEKIRAEGVFNEPRIHFVVNCASIGCPPLRPAAIQAENLEVQLADNTKRFLSDRTRNRYNAAEQAFEVSKIFDWYGGDFEKGHQGITSVRRFLAKYLAPTDADRERLSAKETDLDFLRYDWSLNKSR